MSSEDDPAKLSTSKQYKVLLSHLHLTLLMFFVFSHCAVWFMIFSEGPVSWFKNNYYVKDEGSYHVIAKPLGDSTSSKVVESQIVEDNIELIIRLIGAVCGFIAAILYVSVMLLRKLMQRILRINQMLQVMAITTAILAIILYCVTEMQINFDG